MEKVKVNAIVVGGGPAGLTAAYVMAKEGLEVIVIERGEYSGSKNVGGLLYGTILNKLIPRFYEKAPIERPVSKRALTFLGDDNHFSLHFGSDTWSKPPFNNSYVVYRSQFDKWYAGQVEEAGANLLEGMVVDDLIYESSGSEKKVIGVKIRGEEEFYADVVILAEGATSLVAPKLLNDLGCRSAKTKQQYVVGVKEIIGLPREKIEDRFGLAPNEGAALDFFGSPFEGTIGGGFLYTAKEGVHVGFAARADTIMSSKYNPNDIIDKFKRHPRIKPYLQGGELLEYSAHVIPEGGYDAIPQLFGNGFMIVGDSAGFVNMSLYKEGTNLAMESGMFAGETVVLAKKQNDFLSKALSLYEQKLRKGVVFKDLRKYRKLPRMLEGTPNIFSLYPKKVANLLIDYFTVSEEPKSQLQRRALKNFLRGLPKIKFVRDVIRAKKMC